MLNFGIRSFTVFHALLCLVGIVIAEDRMSTEEKQAVKKFYHMVKDGFTKEVQHEDKYLIRWIRAKDYDLDAAEEFLRRNFAWRKDYQMDNILEEDFTEWEKRAPYNFASHDRQGRPAMVTGMGQLDVRKIALAGQAKELERYLLYGYERGLYNVANAGNSTYYFVDGYLLFNMAGYSPQSHACLACIPSWLGLVQNYERYYPQLVTKFIIINTPRVFETLLAILRPLLSAHTARNLVVYGLNKDEWRPELLKLFAEDQLLPMFGGKLKVDKSE